VDIAFRIAQEIRDTGSPYQKDVGRFSFWSMQSRQLRHTEMNAPDFMVLFDRTESISVADAVDTGASLDVSGACKAADHHERLWQPIN